jgi:hypothetical protein
VAIERVDLVLDGMRATSGSLSAVTAEIPSAYTYIGLPISSGGAHKLGSMKREVAAERIRVFLAECTVPTAPSNDYISRVHVPDLRVPHALKREMKRRFGSTREAQATCQEALDFFNAVDPQPTNEWGMAPIWFFSETRFRIIDPATGSVLPAQSPEFYNGLEYEWRVPLGTSQTRLQFDNRARLGIELCIPNTDDDVLDRVVPWLQDHLPMKLSPKQWRAWYPTKTGSFVARKLAAPIGG